MDRDLASIGIESTHIRLLYDVLFIFVLTLLVEFFSHLKNSNRNLPKKMANDSDEIYT